MSSTQTGKFIGKNNPNWKGGIYIDHDGYIHIYSPQHPNKDKRGYVKEHRLKMEKHLGRYLTKEEIVHHKDSIVNNNNISNLKLFKNVSEHIKYHRNILKT